MFLRVFLQCLVIGFVWSLDYNGYKIYEIKPKTDIQFQKLYRITQEDGVETLHFSHANNRSAHIMVAPIHQQGFESNLNKNELNYNVFVQNVAKSLKENRITKQSGRGHGVPIQFNQYYRYMEINAYLDRLGKEFPNNVVVQKIGTSYEGRAIKTIRITNGDRSVDKKYVLIDAGIHAREWIAPATALFVIHQLVENMTAHSELLRSHDWIILPLVNPDGYEYSHTTDRMWRKTRSRNNKCWGTDGNRNFDYHWGEVGASSWECSETYRGSSAFSEPETRVLRNLMLALKGKGKLYLSLHAYGKYILYPYGWTSSLPSTHADLDEVAAVGAEAIHRNTGSRYTYGSSTRVLYAASGGSDDYAYARAGFPIAITMELPAGGTGFDPKPSEIKGFAEEAWIGIKAMAQRVAEKY